MNPAYLQNGFTTEPPLSRPDHGGDILEFCRRTGVNPEDCLDLSTGIAPWPYPIPKLPQNIWQALPSSTMYESDLIQSAANYYGCSARTILPVAGSQAAIETLPAIAQPGAKVAYPFPGYEEHRFAWQKAGVHAVAYRDSQELKRLISDSSIDHAVVINPNNPTAEIFSLELLEELRVALASRGGFLVVDEAFADPNPKHSMADSIGKNGLILLRSIGKFFGLAGLRLGFIIAPHELTQKLNSQLGLWPVSTVALWLGSKMLSDSTWIESQRNRCANYSDKLLQLASSKFGNLIWRNTDLFVVGFGPAQQVYDYRADLDRAGIHTRLIPTNESHALLRLGLTKDEGMRTLSALSQ